MLKLVEMECENCGGALEQVDHDTVRCPHCDAIYLIDRGQPKEVHVHEAAPVQRKRSGVMIFAGLAIIIGGLIFIAMNLFAITDDQNVFLMVEATEEIAEINAKEEKFRSEFFKALVQEIYGASVETVTEKELEELTSLHIYWENDCDVVEYSRNDGETKQIQMNDSLLMNMEDLKNFPNLKKLNLGSDHIPQVALEQLDSLEELWCGNTPKDLSASLKHPEKLKVLGCFDVVQLDGVDAFTELEHLYVKDYDLTDLNAISALVNLKKLEIIGGDRITDFGVLHSLKQLELLHIEASQLKDISFVKQMENLQDFSLKNTIVIDISSLKGKTALKKVDLQSNMELQDYRALSSLRGIEELTLELGSKAQIPNPSKWKALHTLSISGVSDLSFVKSLTGLKKLCIAGVDCGTMDALTALQDLEYLQIGYVYGELDNLSMLTDLTKLKVLDMSGMSVYGNVEAVFSIASLEELNLNDCSFGLDFDAISKNKNLKKLHMNRMRLWENIMVQQDGAFTYVNYDDVALMDEIEVLKKFPNLEELYLQGDKIVDISFVENLPKLKKLDITNNYVTDLRPLQQLQQLEIVWCGQNAISQGTDLGADVTVVLDSEAEDEKWWR